MSLKTLFTTTTNSATSAVIGLTKFGSVVGSTTEWMADWAESLNSDKAKSIRQQERDWELKQRQMELVRQKSEIDTDALKEAVVVAKEVDEVLDQLF